MKKNRKKELVKQLFIKYLIFFLATIIFLAIKIYSNLPIDTYGYGLGIIWIRVFIFLIILSLIIIFIGFIIYKTSKNPKFRNYNFSQNTIKIIIIIYIIIGLLLPLTFL